MAPVPATTLSAFEGTPHDWRERFSGRPLADDLRELDTQGQSVLIATIRELCRLVPAADVASPKWSGRKPIVVLGRANAAGRIFEHVGDQKVQPLVGLCRQEGRIQLIIGCRTVDAYCVDVHGPALELHQRMAAWDIRRALVEGPSLEPSMLTEDQGFRKFLSWVQGKIVQI